MTDDRTRLLEIQDAIDRTRRHARDGRDAFLASETIRDAVILTLAVIGEAARNLSPELRDANPDVPWKQIIGFRNRVIHGHFSVDPEIVWRMKKAWHLGMIVRSPATLPRSSAAKFSTCITWPAFILTPSINRRRRSSGHGVISRYVTVFKHTTRWHGHSTRPGKKRRRWS